MKIYDQVRGDVIVCVTSFMEEYENQKKIPEARLKDLQRFNDFVKQYDVNRDAYSLRRDVKEYAEGMGSLLIAWISSLSVNKLKALVLQTIKKPEYKKIRILQKMCEEEKKNVVRVEERLTLEMERESKKMRQREQSLESKVCELQNEVARLKSEIKFLTKKLVLSRKRISTLEAKIKEFSRPRMGEESGRELVPVARSGALVCKRNVWNDSKGKEEQYAGRNRNDRFMLEY